MENLDPNFLAKIAGQKLAPGAKPPRHPGMHRTRSIDYLAVLSGEIDMLLDDSEVHLKAGDVMVQRGTVHAWINRGKEVCRIAVAMIDAKEPKQLAKETEAKARRVPHRRARALRASKKSSRGEASGEQDADASVPARARRAIGRRSTMIARRPIRA